MAAVDVKVAEELDDDRVVAAGIGVDIIAIDNA